MNKYLRFLKRIDWTLVEKDVVERIRLLAVIATSLSRRRDQDGETHDLIARDLLVPALELLLKFRECVKVVEQGPPEDN